tara:strand:+ start:7127 stop:8692 length:1566 start_codon:yes stop_codon:yes gene_type:complete
MNFKSLSIIFLLIVFSQGLFSMASAKEKSLHPKSKFQQALENAQTNNANRFQFIDRKGRQRYYEINNGIINEITKEELTSLSPFEFALNNAKKRGLTNFQFTDHKGNKRNYTINKDGIINEKKSLNKNFKRKASTQPKTPRVFKASTQDKKNKSTKISNKKISQNKIDKGTKKLSGNIEEQAKEAVQNTKIIRKNSQKEPYRGMKLSLDNLDYTFKVGTRYWFSEGETEFAHCASVACGGGVTSVGTITGSLGDPTSKLEYTSLRNRAFELTSDLEINNVVLQTNIGLRDKGDTGKFRDFDWITDGASGLPGDGTVYEFSDTISPVKDVSLKYSVWDIGYKIDISDFFEGANISITPFLGYVRYNEMASAYGLFDLADDLGAGDGLTIGEDTLVIQNQIFWAGQRFGAEVDWDINPQTNFLANIAYVENMSVRNEDSHVLRADLGPTPNVISTGEGRGWMIDFIGKYAYNNNLGFEVGYRFWRFEDRNAVNTFGPTFATEFPIRQLYSQRQGFMLGAEYTF